VSDVYERAGLLKANGSVALSKGLEEQPVVINGKSYLSTEILKAPASTPDRRSGSHPCRTTHRWNSSFLWVLSWRGCDG
jgi:hypothetical protein